MHNQAQQVQQAEQMTNRSIAKTKGRESRL